MKAGHSYQFMLPKNLEAASVDFLVEGVVRPKCTKLTQMANVVDKYLLCTSMVRVVRSSIVFKVFSVFVGCFENLKLRHLTWLCSTLNVTFARILGLSSIKRWVKLCVIRAVLNLIFEEQIHLCQMAPWKCEDQ